MADVILEQPAPPTQDVISWAQRQMSTGQCLNASVIDCHLIKLPASRKTPTQGTSRKLIIQQQSKAFSNELGSAGRKAAGWVPGRYSSCRYLLLPLGIDPTVGDPGLTRGSKATRPSSISKRSICLQIDQNDLDENEAIESRMVGRRIQQATHKIERQAVSDMAADSADEWLQRNCPDLWQPE